MGFYNQYLKISDSLSIKEEEIYQSINTVLNSDSEELKELWEDVLLSALKYTEMRTKWNYFSVEEKNRKDSLRTNLHNDFMINLKAFYRLSDISGLSDNWLDKLGPEENRKRWGDFAGYLLLFESIKAR